ncbi:MAG: alpha/beta hydrolase [Anaerolineae bacterium]
MLDIKPPSFVTIKGRKIAYDEVSPPHPKGTILLLTGLAAKRHGWYKQMEVFGREYRTIALDHRDAGDSDSVRGPYRIADQADDAVAVLRALGADKAHVIGISMGGYIALELTLRHTDLVDKLVLVSTSAGGLGHAWPSPRMLTLLVRRGKLEVGELTRRIYSQITAPGYAENHPEEMERIVAIGRYRPITIGAHTRQLCACLRHDVSNRLDRIQVPTLIIHGKDDPLVVVKNGINLARRIQPARLILYPNTGHIPIIERAEEFNRDVLTFLG